jgi:hypothetical protein
MHLFPLVLVLVLGSAWSADPIKPQSYSRTQSTKAEQRGTEKSPVFVKGDVTTKKNEQETKEDAKDREDNTVIDKALVKYTGLAALFTFLLFLAAAFQVGLFVWQLLLINKATKDSFGACQNICRG